MTLSRLLTCRPRHGHRSGPMVVMDIGDDVVSVWSHTTGVVSTGGLNHTDPTRSWLRWLLGRCGVGVIAGLPVFLSVRGPVDETRNVWCAVIEEMGGYPLLIHRPLAAGVALGITDDGRRSHLLVEIFEMSVDLAVVQSGSILLSSTIPRGETGQIRRFADDTLRSLDPDDELEIRDNGALLYGWSAVRHAPETLAALRLPLAEPVASGSTVLNGARIMAYDFLPLLMSHR